MEADLPRTMAGLEPLGSKEDKRTEARSEAGFVVLTMRLLQLSRLLQTCAKCLISWGDIPGSNR
jgi:hypothetical protein